MSYIVILMSFQTIYSINYAMTNQIIYTNTSIWILTPKFQILAKTMCGY
jgi:hypothetical protein